MKSQMRCKTISSPIVEYKYSRWEVAHILWELKRSEFFTEEATVYLDCALKATEVLRYQWSRRFIYYFLHCRKFMRLLSFNPAGLFMSERVNITSETEKFLRCLLLVFWNKSNELGYPSVKEAPHRLAAQGRTNHVIEIDGNLLCLDKQLAGPWKDHLISLAVKPRRGSHISCLTIRHRMVKLSVL